MHAYIDVWKKEVACTIVWKSSIKLCILFTVLCVTGLEEVMDFLEQAFPNVDIAIAHGQVFPPLNLHMQCVLYKIYRSFHSGPRR